MAPIQGNEILIPTGVEQSLPHRDWYFKIKITLRPLNREDSLWYISCEFSEGCLTVPGRNFQTRQSATYAEALLHIQANEPANLNMFCRKGLPIAIVYT